MNVHESEKIAGMLSGLGMTKADTALKAQVIVFNTCCIREAAENKAKSKIGALKSYKQKNPDVIIAVGGCMTQQDGVAETLYKTFPFVDIIFGTHNLYLFKDFLIERQKKGQRAIYIEKGSPLPREGIEVLRDEADNAYVNITYGCDNFCSYCIVPYVRGRERSRKPGDIAAEVKNLAITGKYKTITLLGQNVNSYGKDLKPQVSFPSLLESLAKIEGDFTLAFLTSHPKDMSDDLIRVIKENSKISRDVHLPVQSGSTKILTAMNRKYTREHYLGLIEKIRTITDVRISTDIIVGFPGETLEDFEETLSLVKQVSFGNIYSFMYSKRKGTAAEKLEGHIPLAERNRRVNILINLQREIEKKNKGK